MSAALAAIALLIGVHDSPPELVVNTVRDASARGLLRNLNSDGSVQLTDGRNFAGDQVVAMQLGTAPPNRPYDRPHILFANGDCIPGRIVGIVNDKVRFGADLGQPIEITVPLSLISAIWVKPRAAAHAAVPDTRRELQSPRVSDVIRLTNGDSLTGTLLAISEAGAVQFDRGGSKIEVPIIQIDALLLNSQLTRASKASGVYRRLILRNGARLTVTSVTADSETLTVKLPYQDGVRIPIRELAMLMTFRGPGVYLSDLKPVRYESKPFLAVNWPLVADRSVSGGDLRLGDGTYDKGIGLHSACSVTYAVPPGAMRFEAIVGLNEDTGRRGSVSLRIRSGGRTLFEDGEVTGRRPPREVRAPLGPNDREITIEIGFGRGGDVQDDVDLGDARFVVPPRRQ
jgi:hypothetical protein